MNQLVAGKLLLPDQSRKEFQLMNSKTQVQFANEGAEKKQKEEEIAARKRKLEEKEKWEGESRFNSHSLLYGVILRVSRNRLYLPHRTDGRPQLPMPYRENKR